MATKASLKLEKILDELSSQKDYSNLDLKDNVAIYFEELDDKTTERNIKNANIFNPNLVFYPASLIKLFDSVIVEDEILNSKDFQRKNPKIYDEAMRAIKETIKVSDNDALAYLVDLISESSSGPELSDSEFKRFKKQREKIAEFFHHKNYSKDLKLHNKCFSFDKFGRDKELAKLLGENSCTILDIANIMKEIRHKNPKIYKFLKRDLCDLEDYQTKFIGAGLKNYLVNNKKLSKQQIQKFSFYAKAGWMSKARHDAAIIDEKYLLVIMTKNLSSKTNLIPKIAKKILAAINI